jgi:VWFA-related protein
MREAVIKGLGALIVPILCAGNIVAQTEPITRVTVNQVRIDAVVTDSRGNLIPNLTTADFQVFQDGKPQSPITVQYVAESMTALSRPTRELQAADVRRTIVVILDDADMSFASFNYARKAIQQTLEKAVQRGDLVAILRTTESSSFRDQLFSDPAALRLTIDQLHYRLPFPIPIGFGPVSGLLRSTITALNRMPGRKSVVLFCDHMPPMASTDIYRSLADSALRSAVIVYGIDSLGLSTQSRVLGKPRSNTAESRSPGGPIPFGSRNPDLDPPYPANYPNSAPRELGNLDGLRFLAEETGGLMLENNNDLGSELRQALTDQSGYYLIAWDPGKKAFEPVKKGTVADFHKISVKLTRPGLQLRTPRGFYGFESGAQPSNASPRTTMQEALFAPFQSGRFDARMAAEFHLKDGRPYIRSFVFVAGKDIVFTHHPNQAAGCGAFHLELLTVPQPIDTTVNDLMESQVVAFEVCGASYQTMAKDGVAITMLHPVEKPGGYEMRLAVRNVPENHVASSLTHSLITREENEQPVGSAHQLVVVPDWRTAPAFFGLRIRTGTIPASVIPPKIAGQTDRTSTLECRPAVPGDAALRIFHPGEKLEYHAEAANLADPEAQLRITQSGVQIYAAKSSLAGTWPIPATLPPGAYDLELTVTGKDHKAPNYTATQSIDFTVQTAR